MDAKGGGWAERGREGTWPGVGDHQAETLSSHISRVHEEQILRFNPKQGQTSEAQALEGRGLEQDVFRAVESDKEDFEERVISL